MSAGEADVFHGPNTNVAQESEKLRGRAGGGWTGSRSGCCGHYRVNQEISNSGSRF